MMAGIGVVVLGCLVAAVVSGDSGSGAVSTDTTVAVENSIVDIAPVGVETTTTVIGVDSSVPATDIADLAGDDFTGGVVRQVAGEEDEITGAHGGHVVGDGRIRHGQDETEGGEFRLGRGGRFGGAERRERDEGEAQGGDEETAHGGVTLNL